MTRPAPANLSAKSNEADTAWNHAAESEERTDMNKVARWLLALAVVLVTVSGCGDLYSGVPKGDNVNVLGDQDNR